MSKLEHLWVKSKKGGPMVSVDRVQLTAEEGLEGDANKRLKRQVTILSLEAWEAACAELPVDALDPALRRANLLVSGLQLAETVGRTLRIGPVSIRINGETVPCQQMDDAHFGLRSALEPDWRGGVYGRVIEGGTLSPGAPASFEDSP